MKTKTNTGMDMLGYGLYAFGGLGMEILLMMLEEIVYGNASSWWTLHQQRMHWLLISIVWGGIGYLLLRQRPVSSYQKSTKREKILGAILVLLVVTYTSIVWNGFKPWLEYTSLGPIDFILQYVYYAMESFLITLLLMFGQKAAALWLKKDTRFPFGGILLALTWGLVHMLIQGSETGIYLSIRRGAQTESITITDQAQKKVIQKLYHAIEKHISTCAFFHYCTFFSSCS